MSCGVVLLIVTRVWHKLAEVPTPGSGDGARWRESALPAACLPPPDCWCGTLFKVWTLSSLGPGYQDFHPTSRAVAGQGNKSITAIHARQITYFRLATCNDPWVCGHLTCSRCNTGTACTDIQAFGLPAAAPPVLRPSLRAIHISVAWPWNLGTYWVMRCCPLH